MNIIFFGTPEFAVDILETLKERGFLPALIVTRPDMPVGRKLEITAPETKTWAEAHNIPVFQPKSLRGEHIVDDLKSYYPTGSDGFDVGIVASYGNIIPQAILDLPRHSMLNVHPSLLPHHRGASPIHDTILFGDPFGVTIIKLDADMDHGPILVQKTMTEAELPHESYRTTAEKVLARTGAEILANALPDFVSGTLTLIPQDHNHATFCKKITKADGEVNIDHLDPQAVTETLRKVRAFEGWPGTYFFTEYNGKRIRVVITEAGEKNGLLEIIKVIPEGKKEMLYRDFLRGKRS